MHGFGNALASEASWLIDHAHARAHVLGA